MTLQQSIRLNDGMSSVLRTLQSNLKNTIVEFERMQQVSGQSVDISYMETAAQDIEQISEELRKAQQEQENFQNSTQSSKTATDSLLSSVRNVAVALGGWKAVSGIVELADTLTQTTARLDLMNDGLQTTEQLQNMIYQAAENSRGSYLDMQSMVSKLGLLAGDAFDSSAEIVAFAEQVNKQFAIAGTGATEASNATLQLTQALASGVLRGDELNSIFEQAPTLIQSIADYMGVSVGEIRNLASNGEITADIVKNAILDAADGVDARFNDMPVTWSQAWTSMQNYAIQAFDSVLEKISSATSSDTFQTVYEGAQQAITAIAGAASGLLNE